MIRRKSKKRTTWVSRKSAQRRRAERVVIAKVRAAVVMRDGYCRMSRHQHIVGECSGPSEWHHIEKRSATRGKSPEDRHRTETSIMVCQTHHFLLEVHRYELSYDNEVLGANGPMTLSEVL